MNLSMKPIRWFAAASSLLFLCPCFGKEVFYLTNGFTLQAQSHSQEGELIVLRTATGTLELPSAQVERVESVPDPPQPAAAIVPISFSEARPNDLLIKAANDQGIPPELVRSVAQVESGLRQEAVSPKGARGLMQLMPATAAELGVEPQLADENARGGAKYLRDLLIQFHGDSVLALAAYNAGPAAVAKYGGVPPYAETRRYVQRVLELWQKYAREQKQQSAANKPIATN
jgi:soluble lytic murein transglycosylase-like protein